MHESTPEIRVDKQMFSRVDQPGMRNFLDGVRFLGEKDEKIIIRSPQKFEKKLEGQQNYQKQHLAVAFRVFAKQGFDEGVANHTSLRDVIHRDNFWINPLRKQFS
jgi:hypothetical protein